MVSQRDTWKRFISTALEYLPAYITHYSAEEQVWLKKSLETLQNYEVDTITTRQKFIESWEKTKKEIRSDNTYLTLPFLWFLISYLDRATQLLDVALFHADDFYNYLAKHIRGSNGLGLFPLVQKQVPLSDERWEELQYASLKLIVPLTLEEVEVLGTLYNFSQDGNIAALDIKQIKAAVSNQARSTSLVRRLPRLFARVDARWSLLWHYPAFDLTQVYFRVELTDSVDSLSEIIDLRNPANTTLRGSNVFEVRDTNRMYLGTLLVPVHQVRTLKEYLEICQQDDYLKLHECEPITIMRHTSSLADYKPSKGWQKWNVSSCLRLIEELKPKKQRIRHARTSLYITSFSSSWHYYELPNPTEIIPLICQENLDTYKTFQELSNQELISDHQLLNTLFRNKVVTVVFCPNRLIREYTIPEYWITLSRIPFAQLSHLLKRLPYTTIHRTKQYYHIWAVLNPFLGDWLRRELKWEIRDIIFHYVHQPLKLTDYDFKDLEWKTPQILEEY